MRSIIRRLEALEAAPGLQSLVLLVTLKDGEESEMGIAEFKKLTEGRYPGYGFSVRIVSGDSRKERDEYISTVSSMLADVAYNPAPNRNIADFE